MSVMAEQETKVCACCEKPFPESSFTATEWRKNGECRTCRRNYMRGYMAAARRVSGVEALLQRVDALEEVIAELTQRAA
jgi:hypothetical protein